MPGEGPTDDIDDIVGTGGNKHGINLTKAKTKFCLSLHCNDDNSYSFVTEKNLISLKPTTKIASYSILSMRHIWKIWLCQVSEISFKGIVSGFSFDYDAIDQSDVLKIYQLLIVKKNNVIITFRLITKVFATLLRFSSHSTKCISLSNELWLVRPTLSHLNSNELDCYPFMAGLDRCSGSFNIVDDLSSRMCAPNKTEDVNLNVFNMITRNNKSKALTKHFMWLQIKIWKNKNVIQIKSGVENSVDVSAKI